MKKTMRIISAALTAFMLISQARAQDITGNWQSADKSRVFTIFKTGDRLEAVLQSSIRSSDREGAVVLKSLAARSGKNKYRGTILAPDDGMQMPVTVRVNPKKPGILKLKLKRMLFLPVTIRWYRTEDSAALN